MNRTYLALALLAFSSRCATVVHGRYQHVPVRSTPSGAAIRVDCGDAPTEGGLSPADVVLRRGAEHCTLTLSKIGYAEQVVTFTRARSAVAWTNLGAGIGIGLVAGIGATPIFSDTGTDNSRGNTAALGGIAVGTGVGLLVDHGTGALYRQTPSTVDVSLSERTP